MEGRERIQKDINIKHKLSTGNKKGPVFRQALLLGNTLGKRVTP